MEGHPFGGGPSEPFSRFWTGTLANVNQVVKVKQAEAAALLTERRNAIAHRAFEMRRRGMSFWEIAEELQLPEAEIKGIANEAIRIASSMVDEATKRELLEMEIARLDDLQVGIYDLARQGDIRSIETVLKIVHERVRIYEVSAALTGTATTVNAVIVPSSETEYVAALRAIAEGRIAGAVKEPEWSRPTTS